jgi:cytochrome c oxidase subunit 2
MTKNSFKRLLSALKHFWWSLKSRLAAFANRFPIFDPNSKEFLPKRRKLLLILLSPLASIVNFLGEHFPALKPFFSFVRKIRFYFFIASSLFRICTFFFPGVFELSLGEAAENYQIGFQDPATPIMQGLIDLHHDIFSFLVFVLLFVVWILVRTVYRFHHTKSPVPAKIIHGTVIEIAWTVAPTVILMLIALPSFALLYSTEELVDPAITLKAIGHQWYWTYEYSDYSDSDDTSIVYDSYMIPEDDLELGQLRLLEVDNRVVLPIQTYVRVILTSADVLHSWAVPSLGVKCDAVPGRLNQTSLFLKREGVFYGQCSELCGANHGFMPIVVEGVPLDDYSQWVSTKMEEL